MTPYGDSREHLLEELSRLDLLCRRYLERWWAERGGAAEEFRGLYVSDEEVLRLLRRTPGESRDGQSTAPGPGGRVDGARDAGGERAVGVDDDLASRLESAARDVRRRERLTADAGTELRLVALEELFGLEACHRDVLLVALAPEVDRKYEKIYAYLQDDITRTRPTAGLALRLLCSDDAERLAARSVLSPGSPLREHRLLRIAGEEAGPLPSRVLGVDERVVRFLLGDDEVAEGLADLATVLAPEAEPADLALDAERTRAVEAMAARYPVGEDRRPPLTYVHGPDGSGKDAVVEALCAGHGTPLLRADAGKLAGRDVPALLDALVREARLQGAAPHVADLDRLPSGPDADRDGDAGPGAAGPGGAGGAPGGAGADPAGSVEPADVARALDGVDGPVFLTGTEPVSPGLQADIDGHDLVTLELPVPSYRFRRSYWASVDGLPEGVDPADLAGKFRLTPGGIDDAVATARAHADGEGLTAESLYVGCRAQSRERLGSLAQKIEPGYGWEDVVLPPDRRRHLEEVAAHVEHRGTVYSEWGFEEKYSLGNGLNVLFTGPPGTGKTMSAEIIAGEAGLDLYRIDLSSVVSKYVGETEKNLRAVFDEAERSDAILFFDEADALFGERSEVRDSHDRYANVEVSYLLQRMEAHDGAVILASNLKENIDDAFLRRINLSVEFPLPDRDARAEIWRSVFPADVPRGDLDVEFLAEFEIAGGNIKNVALTASFLAADEDGPVEMAHVVRALFRELQKAGRLVNPGDFGEYRELLPG